LISSLLVSLYLVGATAELVLASIASYVASEMINRALSELFRKLGKQAAADKLLQRLEMLLVKMRSAIEVSEKHSIESASLLRWKEKLMEAASRGHAVLDSFNQRAMNTQAAAMDTDDQQGSTPTTTPAAASNTTSANDNDDAASRAFSFTGAALSSMQHGMRDAANKMFSGDEDMQKLKDTVKSLDELSSGIGEFTQLLQLEVLPKEEEASGSRTRRRGRERTPPGVESLPLKRKKQKRRSKCTCFCEAGKPLFSLI
jgi:methyl-accepting chemotaxis protein